MLTRGGNRVPAGRDLIRWTEKGWLRNSDILGCLPRWGGRASTVPCSTEIDEPMGWCAHPEPSGRLPFQPVPTLPAPHLPVTGSARSEPICNNPPNG